MQWMIIAFIFHLFDAIRWKNGSVHQRAANLDCLLATAGWQDSRNFPGRPYNCQLHHVHYDPGHVLCHPQRGCAQPASPLPQHSHDAHVGPQSKMKKKRKKITWLKCLCVSEALVIWRIDLQFILYTLLRIKSRWWSFLLQKITGVGQFVFNIISWTKLVFSKFVMLISTYFVQYYVTKCSSFTM